MSSSYILATLAGVALLPASAGWGQTAPPRPSSTDTQRHAGIRGDADAPAGVEVRSGEARRPNHHHAGHDEGYAGASACGTPLPGGAPISPEGD